MIYDLTAQRLAHQKLPAGWRIAVAGDYGFFVQSYVTGQRSGEFHPTLEACLKAAAKLRPQEFDPLGAEQDGVRYLHFLYAHDLPRMGEGGDCPHCGEFMELDYDSNAYVGMTTPEGDRPPTWTEAWKCGCGLVVGVERS